MLTDNKIIEITRKWVKWNCINGSTVTWGSEEQLDMTPAKLERFAFYLLESARKCEKRNNHE